MLDRLLPIVPQGVTTSPAADGPARARRLRRRRRRARSWRRRRARRCSASREAEVSDDPARAPAGGASGAGRRSAGGSSCAPRARRRPARGLLDVVHRRDRRRVRRGHAPDHGDVPGALLGLEPGGAFADLGCGTGVLAIVAGKLGWGPPLVAIDHEPVALEATEANARRNGVEVDALQRRPARASRRRPRRRWPRTCRSRCTTRIAAALAPETPVRDRLRDRRRRRSRTWPRPTAAPGSCSPAQAVRRSWAAALLVRRDA